MPDLDGSKAHTPAQTGPPGRLALNYPLRTAPENPGRKYLVGRDKPVDRRDFPRVTKTPLLLAVAAKADRFRGPSRRHTPSLRSASRNSNRPAVI
jgi:hypothetical protein